MTNLFQETKILVAGSINPKISKEYSEAAKVIGEYIYEKNYALVFDGCFGLPGEVAKRMVEMGKEKYKQWDEWMALPAELKEKKDISYPHRPKAIISYDDFHFGMPKWIDVNFLDVWWQCNNRHQSDVTRKLIDTSDHMIFLKGNSGTLAELFYALDTKKNKEHNKSICILNRNHQWDALEALLKQLGLEKLYHIVDTVEKAIQYIDCQIELEKSDIER